MRCSRFQFLPMRFFQAGKEVAARAARNRSAAAPTQMKGLPVRSARNRRKVESVVEADQGEEMHAGVGEGVQAQRAAVPQHRTPAKQQVDW